MQSSLLHLQDAKMENEYLLKSNNEYSRLELQNSHPNYSIDRELNDKEVTYNKRVQIIDVGCGSGAVTKKILKANSKRALTITSIDTNIQILKQMQNSLSVSDSLKVQIKKESADNLKSIKSNQYDSYYCRFLLEHNPKSAQAIIDEAYRVLKIGGTATIIDADKVLLGIKTNDDKVNDDLKFLKESLVNYSDEICTQIPKLLHNAGFKIVGVKQIPTLFLSAEDKRFEAEMYRLRLNQAKPILLKFWTEEKINQFTKDFLFQIESPLTFIAYEKFVFKAIKLY